MRANGRLDVVVIPVIPESVPDTSSVQHLLTVWSQRQILKDIEGKSGLRASCIFNGGFERLCVLRPDGMRFIANQQGGFRVYCHQHNMTQAFVGQMKKWRTGGERSLMCPHCSVAHPLEDLSFKPPAGFYSFALEFRSVGSAYMSEDAVRELRDLMGPIKIVFRRIG